MCDTRTSNTLSVYQIGSQFARIMCLSFCPAMFVLNFQNSCSRKSSGDVSFDRPTHIRGHYWLSLQVNPGHEPIVNCNERDHSQQVSLGFIYESRVETSGKWKISC